jgi:hypothetical protein
MIQFSHWKVIPIGSQDFSESQNHEKTQVEYYTTPLANISQYYWPKIISDQ